MYACIVYSGGMRKRIRVLYNGHTVLLGRCVYIELHLVECEASYMTHLRIVGFMLCILQHCNWSGVACIYFRSPEEPRPNEDHSPGIYMFLFS